MRSAPVVVSVEMGYGHLRAALPLVHALNTPLLHADQPPLADEEEHRLWSRVRWVQEILSKPMQLGVGLMDAVTKIPPLHERHLSEPHLGARGLDFLIERGLGRGLVGYLRDRRAPLVTTFYAPAIIADRAGLESYCVVTDADINRVWAPVSSHHSKIQYFAPSTRAVRRLVAYGVPRSRITLTGFPLPPELLGGPDLDVARRNLARRIVRLDPGGYFRELHRQDVERVLGTLPGDQEKKPPRLTFAVGGAGAQAEMAFDFLPSFRDAIVAGDLEVTLVAGMRSDVEDTFARAVDESGLSGCVAVLVARDFDEYYRKFNALLAETDILWTKPSEMSFYAALGLALVLAKPLGSHERFNRRWLREQGVALKQHQPRHAASWMAEWLEDGTLAAAAWTGFVRLPKEGTYRIAAALEKQGAV